MGADHPAEGSQHNLVGVQHFLGHTSSTTAAAYYVHDAFKEEDVAALTALPTSRGSYFRGVKRRTSGSARDLGLTSLRDGSGIE